LFACSSARARCKAALRGICRTRPEAIALPTLAPFAAAGEARPILSAATVFERPCGAAVLGWLACSARAGETIASCAAAFGVEAALPPVLEATFAEATFAGCCWAESTFTGAAFAPRRETARACLSAKRPGTWGIPAARFAIGLTLGTARKFAPWARPWAASIGKTALAGRALGTRRLLPAGRLLGTRRPIAAAGKSALLGPGLALEVAAFLGAPVAGA
jgi:hypothetical protein